MTGRKTLVDCRKWVIAIVLPLAMLSTLYGCHKEPERGSRPGCTLGISWQQPNGSSCLIGIKTLPPNGMRKTIVLRHAGAEIAFAIRENQTLDSIIVCESNRICALMMEVRVTRLSADGESCEGFYDFADFGELCLVTNGSMRERIEWISFLLLSEREELKRRQISIIGIQPEKLHSVRVTFNIPISRNGNMLTWAPFDAVYDIERKEFLPHLSQIVGRSLDVDGRHR